MKKNKVILSISLAAALLFAAACSANSTTSPSSSLKVQRVHPLRKVQLPVVLI